MTVSNNVPRLQRSSMKASRRGRQLMATSLTAMAVLASLATASTSGNAVQPEPRLLAQIANVFAANDPAPNAAAQSSFISKALSLAGTDYPTVTPMDGASNPTPTTPTTTPPTTTPPTTTPPTTTPPSTTPPTTTPPTTTPPVQTPQQTKPATTTATETWSWAAGAYGCGSVSASGKYLLCYGTATINQRDAIETSAPLQARSSEIGGSTFEFMERAPSATSLDEVEMPDLGWLDSIVGGVPYKSGDFIASVVWIIVTLALIPLLAIRLMRRSSSIMHVLFAAFLWGSTFVGAVIVRALLSRNTPTTMLMIAQNALLQLLPSMLLEPLLVLVAMYAVQGGHKSGVPFVCLILRLVNLIAFVLFAATAGFTGVYLHEWDQALMTPLDMSPKADLPSYTPAKIISLGPVLASVMLVAAISGGLLLIPVAHGHHASAKSGGFLAMLFILLISPVVYRVMQSLHAQTLIADQASGDNNPFANVATSKMTNKTSSMIAKALMELANTTVAQAAQVAPPGMYNNQVSGIAWGQLQQTMASRMAPQTPIIFNLAYILPMWLEVLLLFFVHAPGNEGAKMSSETA